MCRRGLQVTEQVRLVVMPRNNTANHRTRAHTGPPMMLGNMGENGVRQVDVSCWICHCGAILDVRPVQIPRTGIIRFAGSFITVLALNVSVAEIAAAQSRPDTTRMSCAAARALVLRHGAIVLGTGRSRFDPNAPPLFDRYVNSQAFCMRDEVTEPAFVPTADNPQCFIGYTCRNPRPAF